MQVNRVCYRSKSSSRACVCNVDYFIQQNILLCQTDHPSVRFRDTYRVHGCCIYTNDMLYSSQSSPSHNDAHKSSSRTQLQQPILAPSLQQNQQQISHSPFLPHISKKDKNALRNPLKSFQHPSLHVFSTVFLLKRHAGEARARRHVGNSLHAKKEHRGIPPQLALKKILLRNVAAQETPKKWRHYCGNLHGLALAYAPGTPVPSTQK